MGGRRVLWRRDGDAAGVALAMELLIRTSVHGPGALGG